MSINYPEIINYAKENGPHEICGFLVSEGEETHFIKCDNKAEDPFNFFEIASADWERAEEIGEIIALVHSHPYGHAVLSTADRQLQPSTGVDWLLVCGNKTTLFRNIPPLLGRRFEHKHNDCYALFRDAYMLAGVDFPEFEYVEDWYKRNQNLYIDNLIKYGFEKVDKAQMGDVVMVQAGADVANHAAIYLGDNIVLHHAPHRLSKRDFYDGYWKKHTHSIWRYKEWWKLDFTGILNDLAVNQ